VTPRGHIHLADGSIWDAPGQERPPPPFLDSEETSHVVCFDCNVRPARARCVGCPLERAEQKRRRELLAKLDPQDPPHRRWGRRRT